MPPRFGPARPARGFDIGSDAIRREAAEIARDTGLATFTGRIHLIQDRESKSAVLFLLPLYRPGVPLDSIADRRAALLGWVYQPIRIADLMSGIVGEEEQDVDLEVFDGATAAAENVLHDDDNSLHALDPAYRCSFRDTVVIHVGGRRWTLHFTTRLHPRRPGISSGPPALRPDPARGSARAHRG